MNVLEFTLLVWLGSVVAGFLGALTGLGGGVVIVPLLATVFHVDLRYAIGASLVSVIATSSGAAAAYVKEGFTNIRIGMFLEVATTFGALAGAYLNTRIPGAAIAIIFGVILLVSAYLSGRQKSEFGFWRQARSLGTEFAFGRQHANAGRAATVPCSPRAAGLRDDVRGRNSFGPAGHWGRGLQSAGDGSGHAHSVQGFHHHQQFHDRRDGGGKRRHLSGARPGRSGFGDAGDAGRFAGRLVGARVLPGAATGVLRIVFAIVIVALGIEMIYKGFTGNL